MKALKILGIIAAVLASAVAVVFFGWLSPPAADEVCGNVTRIVKDKLGTVPKTVETQCQKTATTAPEFGRAIWVKRLRCQRDAKDFDALKTCDAIRSL